MINSNHPLRNCGAAARPDTTTGGELPPENTSTSRLISAARYRRDRGISSATLWREIKLGYWRPVRVANRLYLDRAEVEAFERMAFEGQLAKPPSGAAAKTIATPRRECT